MAKPSSRADELTQRFDAIKESVTAVAGERLAFAAVSAAWLRGVQYAAALGFDKATGIRPGSEKLDELEEHIESLLRSYHRELCKELGVDVQHALDLSKSFEQALKDALKGE